MVIGDRLDGSGLALTMPASEAVTQTVVAYGAKGMGKTNLAAVIAEELAKNGARFALLDPVGVSWGLRHSADGKGEGIKLIILGGRHGDLPIEPTAGAVVADFVVDESENVLIDISARADGRRWSMGEKIRFVADYLARLLERNGEQRRPIMQMIDEAARFAPQTIPHGAVDMARCLGALEAVVEEGRNSGIGICLITQRSARMAKSVSELAEVMFAFRTVGPNSVEAVLDWLGEHVEKSRWKELVETIRKLPRGQAVVVSPGWLKYEGVAAIRLRETFDSSKTPTGTEQRLAKRVKAPDLDAYRARMAETIEKAEAADPRKLNAKLEAEKKRTAGVEKELGVARAAIVAHAEKIEQLQERLKAKLPKVKSTPAITEADRVAIAKLAEVFDAMPLELHRKISEAADVLRNNLDTFGERMKKETRALLERPGLQKILAKLEAAAAGVPAMPEQMVAGTLSAATVAKARQDLAAPRMHITPSAVRVPVPRPAPRGPWREDDRIVTSGGDLTVLTRAMLTALAQHGRRNRQQVLLLAQYQPSGNVSKAFAGLLEHGLVTGNDGGLEITARGREILGPFDPLPSGSALRESLLDGSSKLSQAEKKIIGAGFALYPNPARRLELLDRAQLKPSGNTSTAFAKFLKLGWFVERDGGIVAADTFFE